MRNHHRFAFISVILFSLISCTVQLVPDFDEKIYNSTVAIGKQVDSFFISVLDTKSDQRFYSQFADDFSSIEAEIGSLLLQQEARSKNEDMIDATSRTLKMWTDNKAAFQSDDLFYRNDGRVNLHKSRFADAFTAIAKGEKFLQSTGGVD
jgi:hypothetical protein